MSTTQPQPSQYQKFRLQKLTSHQDDDNQSAHFSNPHSTMTDRQQDLLTRKILFPTLTKASSGKEGGQEKYGVLMGRLQEKERECNQLYARYGELMRKYEECERDRDCYRRKYEERVARERETKEKLEGWVRSAKSDLLSN